MFEALRHKSCKLISGAGEKSTHENPDFTFSGFMNYITSSFDWQTNSCDVNPELLDTKCGALVTAIMKK